MDYTNIKPEIKGKQLTNGQLIELLQTLPKEALVWHEGCDCLGEADRVEFCKEKNEILIGRCNGTTLGVRAGNQRTKLCFTT